jgi:hypothetical protein
MDPADHDAPTRRDEPDLTVNLAACNSSTLFAIMSDLRDRPGNRAAVALLQQRVDDRRVWRREAEDRFFARKQAEKQA